MLFMLWLSEQRNWVHAENVKLQLTFTTSEKKQVCPFNYCVIFVPQFFAKLFLRMSGLTLYSVSLYTNQQIM